MAFFGSASSHKPDCEKSCGNVSIPYPFGSGEGCYYNRDFDVTCDRSSDEPVLLFGPSSNNAVIKSISIKKAEMEIMMHVANDCYNKVGHRVYGNTASLTLSKFQISAKNRFVAIGCDTRAHLEGTIGNETVSSGCSSKCRSNKYITNKSCSGVGCCEIIIPKGLSSLKIAVSSYKKHINIADFNPCSYALIIEDGKYDFSSSDLLGSIKKKPMLLDWAIGNLTCVKGNKESGKSACKGNSECDPDYTGPGYRCRCLKGYEGNPYIPYNCSSKSQLPYSGDLISFLYLTTLAETFSLILQILMSVKPKLLCAMKLLFAMIFKEAIHAIVKKVSLEMLAKMDQAVFEMHHVSRGLP